MIPQLTISITLKAENKQFMCMVLKHKESISMVPIACNKTQMSHMCIGQGDLVMSHSYFLTTMHVPMTNC